LDLPHLGGRDAPAGRRAGGAPAGPRGRRGCVSFLSTERTRGAAQAADGGVGGASDVFAYTKNGGVRYRPPLLTQPINEERPTASAGRPLRGDATSRFQR